MSTNHSTPAWGVLFLPLVLLTALPGFFAYRAYLKIALDKAVGLFFLATLAGAAVVASNIREATTSLRSPRDEFLQFLVPAAMFVFTLCLVPFLFKLYRKWISGDVTEEENRPGIEGVRAWIRGGNLVCALLIAITAWRGFGTSFFGVLILCLAALVAYPILRSLGSQPAASSPSAQAPDASLSSERDRVLRMLENGSIQPDEGAELLSALGESVPAGAHPLPTRPPLTPIQRRALGGAVLVFVGFVLPWFSINPGREMQRAVDRLGTTFSLPEMPRGMDLPFENLVGSLQTGTLRISGADIGNGLGWVILFMAAMIALFANVPTLAEAATRRLLSLAAFFVGTALLMYLGWNGFRGISIGFPLVIAGYAGLALSLFRGDAPGYAATGHQALTK